MRTSFVFLRVVSVLSVCASAMAISSPAQAVERGFYLGTDVAQLQTTIDYGVTESYTTSHARLKGGYQFLDFLSVEGRIMSSGNDTDIDFLGDRYSFDTGTMYGFYVRPHTNFRTANVYGIVGLTVMNTSYRFVNGGPVDNDRVLVETIGVGGDFRIAGNLSLTVEAQVYVGTADYKSYFFTSVDLTGYGLSAGLRYRF